MSRTRHHKNQKHQHNGHEYGSKLKCNKHYGNSYGVDGRDLGDSERRNEERHIIIEELKEIYD